MARPEGYPPTPVLDSREGPDSHVEQPCDGRVMTHSSRVLGPFLDWLRDQGIVLAKVGVYDDHGWEELVPDGRSYSRLLHDYYGIDENAEERERQAILDWLRTRQEARA